MLGHQNMDRGRYALVRITTSHDWLTCGGDEHEETGWEEIKDALNCKKIIPDSTHHSPRVELTFVEWTGEDQE